MIDLDQPDSQQLVAVADAICLQLHAAVAAAPGRALWLAVDGNTLPLDETLADALAPLAAEAVTVPLHHSSILPEWQPRWYPLQLEKARDSEILRLSVLLAVLERRPEALQTGSGRRIAGWFMLRDKPLQAAQHCGSQMIQTKATDKRQLLRLHDPAVLWALWPLLSPDQQSALFAPMSDFWLLPPLGPCIRFDCAPTPLAQSSMMLSLTAEQWPDIELIAPLNTALRMLLANSAILPAELNTLHEIGLAALRRANRIGFADSKDLAGFAERALTIHPQFDRHPRIQKLLANYRPGDFFGGLVAELSEQDWQQIRQQATAPSFIPAGT